MHAAAMRVEELGPEPAPSPSPSPSPAAGGRPATARLFGVVPAPLYLLRDRRDACRYLSTSLFNICTTTSLVGTLFATCPFLGEWSNALGWGLWWAALVAFLVLSAAMAYRVVLLGASGMHELAVNRDPDFFFSGLIPIAVALLVAGAARYTELYFGRIGVVCTLPFFWISWAFALVFMVFVTFHLAQFSTAELKNTLPFWVLTVMPGAAAASAGGKVAALCGVNGLFAEGRHVLYASLLLTSMTVLQCFFVLFILFEKVVLSGFPPPRVVLSTLFPNAPIAILGGAFVEIGVALPIVFQRIQSSRDVAVPTDRVSGLALGASSGLAALASPSSSGLVLVVDEVRVALDDRGLTSLDGIVSLEAPSFLSNADGVGADRVALSPDLLSLALGSPSVAASFVLLGLFAFGCIMWWLPMALGAIGCASVKALASHGEGAGEAMGAAVRGGAARGGAARGGADVERDGEVEDGGRNALELSQGPTLGAVIEAGLVGDAPGGPGSCRASSGGAPSPSPSAQADRVESGDGGVETNAACARSELQNRHVSCPALVSAASRSRRRRAFALPTLPSYTPAWWGPVFPVGLSAALAFRLGEVLDVAAFGVVGCVVGFCCTCAWAVVVTVCCVDMYTGKMFVR